MKSIFDMNEKELYAKFNLNHQDENNYYLKNASAAEKYSHNLVKGCFLPNFSKFTISKHVSLDDLILLKKILEYEIEYKKQIFEPKNKENPVCQTQ